MSHPVIFAVAIILGLGSIPCMAANGTEEVKTFLVRASDGVPARVTKQACDIVQGSPDSAMVCLRANQRHDTIVTSLKRAGFSQNDIWANGLVIYDVTITPRDGIGYTVRTRYGSLEMVVNGSIHQDLDVPRITERLNRASIVLMNGARIATPGELSSLR